MLGIGDWLLTQFRAIIATTHGVSSVIGILIGIFLSEFIAHMLPPRMDSYAADRLTRLVCFGASSCATFALDVSLLGFFLAMLTGLAGPTLHQVGSRWLYSKFPQTKPEALKP